MFGNISALHFIQLHCRTFSFVAGSVLKLLSEQSPRQQSLLQLTRNVMVRCDSHNPPLYRTFKTDHVTLVKPAPVRHMQTFSP